MRREIKSIFNTKIFDIIFALSISVTSYFFFSIESFNKVSGGILIMFSILTGLLAQAMVFTGQLSFFDKLPEKKIHDLSNALEVQQNEWRKQFYLSMISIIFCMISPAVESKTFAIFDSEEFRGLYVCFSVFFILLTLSKSFGIPNAIISLQKTRFMIFEDSANMDIVNRNKIDNNLEKYKDSSAFSDFEINKHHGSQECGEKIY